MHSGQVRVATKRDQEARDKMRKAKGLLSIVAGLVLMFQAGTSVAYADDSKHKATAKTDDKAQVSAKAESKSGGQAKASVSAGASAQTGTSTQQKSSPSSEQKASNSSSEKASNSSSEKASNSASAKASNSASEKASNSSSAKGSTSASSDQTSEAKTEQQTSGQEHTSNSPPGNNGDIKVHMITTDQSDHRNQPKPGCTFYIDGFNFDSHSSGQWQIDGQGQTTGRFGNGTWSADGNGGNWRSGDMTLDKGHYKVSAWQTLPNDPSGGDKTKVFKTDCGQ